MGKKNVFVRTSCPKSLKWRSHLLACGYYISKKYLTPLKTSGEKSQMLTQLKMSQRSRPGVRWGRVCDSSAMLIILGIELTALVTEVPTSKIIFLPKI